MYHTNAAYKQKVTEFPQNYRMEIEVIYDAEIEDSLETLHCEDGAPLETEIGEALEYPVKIAETVIIPPDDIFEAGFSENVFLNNFCIGSSVRADFWVRIFNENGKYRNDALATAEIHPRVTLYDDAGEAVDTVPIGVFYVDQITVQNNDLRLGCYDRMQYLEKLFVPQETETSLYEIGRRIAATVRSNFSTAPLNSSTIGTLPIYLSKVNDSIFKGYTNRQVIELIAEVCGSFAIFNPDGDLELRWFKKADVELRGDWANAALELNGNTFSLDGNVVQVTGVRVVYEDTELAHEGTDDYLLTINENPIAAAMPIAAAKAVLYRMRDTRYIPCKWCRIGGDPSLQLGDILTVIDNKTEYNEADYDSYDKYPLYMTARSWTFNGGFSDKYISAGNAETDLNRDRGMTISKRIAKLAKRVTEAEKSITEGMDDRELALLLFNEKMFNAMGLYKTVLDKDGGGVIIYYHDEAELENSQTIYMFGTSGFAWTTDGWNNGEPLWRYGFTDAGDAILNTINAYIVSADLIKAGLLRSKNGASWINMDDGTFCFRAVKDKLMDLDTGEMSYTYENKLSLDDNGELGVYGELRSSQFPQFSIGIGPSVDDDSEVYIGAIALRATDSSYTSGDIFQIVDSSIDGEKSAELRFPFLTSAEEVNSPGIQFQADDISIDDGYNTCFHYGIGKSGYTESIISNEHIKFGIVRDTISVSGNYLNDVWFNYYEPYSNYVTKYHFGTGYNLGYASVYAAGFNTVSDPKFKENVREISELNALEKINRLKFYSYDYKSPSEEVQTKDFTAVKHSARFSQEDLKTIPKPIHENIGIMATEAPEEILSTDGKAIDLYAYINLLAKAIQELTEEIATLKEKNKKFESTEKEV